MTTRQQIKDILDKDLPWTITCSYCERDFDLELDLDQVIDDLEKLIKEASVPWYSAYAKKGDLNAFNMER